MKNKLTFLLVLVPFFFTVSSVPLTADEEHEHGEHGEHASDRSHIAPEMAERLGITTAVAGSGIIAKTVTVYGRLTNAPGDLSHVRARFPGLITEVRAQVGDRVEAGDVLATVESNESLNEYQIRSPLTGVVTQRHASAGESTLDRSLFTIANFELLWAELKIFPGQRGQVSSGGDVVLSSGKLSQRSSLRHFLPSGDEHPFLVARAEVDNSEGQWAPGQLVQGSIHTDQINVPLLVPNQALQTMDGQTVVFVVEGEEFATRPVETGHRDDQNTEIISGLQAGEPYVVNNSYLIKADIEKSGAEHHH